MSREPVYLFCKGCRAGNRSWCYGNEILQRGCLKCKKYHSSLDKIREVYRAETGNKEGCNQLLFNHYYEKHKRLPSSICKYKCVNCRNEKIFDNSNIMTVTYNYGSKLRYYVIHIQSLYDNRKIEIPLNHKTQYNYELELYIRYTIKTKIANHDYSIKLSRQFILQLIVLYNFGNLPRDLIMYIMLPFFY